MSEFLKKNWFFIGIIALSTLTLIDSSGTTAGLGRWWKAHHGADTIIFLIFFLSGLILQTREIKAGLRDVTGTLLTLALIFLIAPALACVLALYPMDPGIRIGLFLVAVMPTTLTSGVVMTGTAGGNMAHALLITIMANGMSILTVPFSLAWLLQMEGGLIALPIDKARMMVQIGLLVLLPLFLGLMLRPKGGPHKVMVHKIVLILNQCLVLAIVWIALSGAKAALLDSRAQMFFVLLLSFFFHGILLVAAFLMGGIGRLGPGRRESLIFMGGQKTLPLSVLIQMTLFPTYGLALAFCVVHHIIHLIMDSYLVGRLARL